MSWGGIMDLAGMSQLVGWAVFMVIYIAAAMVWSRTRK